MKQHVKQRVMEGARFLVALAGICLVGSGSAPAASSGHLVLEEILVTASTPDTAAALKINAKSIESTDNFNISDAIRDQPDITSSRRAAVGDTADTVAIRGLSGNRIMLNIDGRSVNSAGVVGGHYIDWGTLPLDNIEKIEIIRGGSSVRYGNNALGGVVNVITRRPTTQPTLILSGNLGRGDDFTTQNYRFNHSYRVGPLGYSVAGSFQKSGEHLWNNDFEGRNLSLKADLDTPWQGLFSLGIQFSNAERGFIRNNRQSANPDMPGFHQAINPRYPPRYPVAFGEDLSGGGGNAFTPGPGSHWDKTKYYFDLGYSQPLGDALAELKIYKNYENRDEKSYSRAEVAGYDDGSLVLDRTVESDRSYGGVFTISKAFGAHEVLVGVDHQVLAYGDTTINFVDNSYNTTGFSGWAWGTDSYQPSQKGETWGYYLQDDWQISEQLLLTAGVRYDRYHNKAINGSTLPALKDEAVTPRLTLSYDLTPVDKMTVAAYQAMRTPGMPETYWWAEGDTNGDPALKPEKNKALELTYRRQLAGSGFLRLAAYRYAIDDYIMFRFDSGGFRGVYNLEQAMLQGASLGGRLELTDWLSGRANLTWQDSRKKGDIYDSAALSDEIDYLPTWKGNLGAEIKLPRRMVLNADLRYVGKREGLYSYSSGWPAVTQFKLMELDAYTTLDIDLRIPVRDKGEIGLYVDNLFDRGYEERLGYPLPGRVLGATFKATF